MICVGKKSSIEGADLASLIDIYPMRAGDKCLERRSNQVGGNEQGNRGYLSKMWHFDTSRILIYDALIDGKIEWGIISRARFQ